MGPSQVNLVVMTSQTPVQLIDDDDRTRLVQRRHHAPHDVLGVHSLHDGRGVLRTVQCGASAVTARLAPSGDEIQLEHIGDDIFAAALTVPASEVATYELDITWADGSSSTISQDPYRQPPTVGDVDQHLIGEGRHERLWEVLGAHLFDDELCSFAVWAPHAAGVSIIGDFNGWNPRQHPMRALGSSGIWEISLPGVSAGSVYKFHITTGDGVHMDKADPMARLAERSPATGSIVVAPSRYEWNDGAWLAKRATAAHDLNPMSIYEVHFGSWRKGLSYQDMATELVDYVREKGFTHVELMGISEHPFEPSWGYQVTSYYAPNNRFGSPDDLRALIDAFHQAGIGVIMDWVPGHFPKDEWALGKFDGQACYEHPDPRRGEQPDWGTYVFDFGRAEVKNFLVANALYWCREFHIDGLRVDAVASILYLDYSREEGEWLPNIYGGRENLDAVSFLQEMNATVHRDSPGVLTIAEESTSWPGVTAPTSDNGLGFSLKWNMGWMHDTLEYVQRDPIHRSHHHGEITFSMVYAYSEKYVLPISHDEVVHGKGTLWSRMPAGHSWDRAAMVRALLAYMWTHPGKKLLFQGQEWGQPAEWNEAKGLDWADLEGWEGEFHRGISGLVSQLNQLYTSLPALSSSDHDPRGFRWIAADDAANNVLSYLRRHKLPDGSDQWVACVVNFSGSSYSNYRIGLPVAGTWREVLNTDATEFEGAGRAVGLDLDAQTPGSHGLSFSAHLDVPAHSARVFLLS
ncbi:1,4-alpha-glucan branching enzyme GlgB [Corynebacterium auriscanis]|nr:1,4-alpha-glucan branching enzyme GlgB [Corynebacterium auriscanis]